MATPIDEGRLKELLKAAVVEVLEERRDLLRDVVEEAIEDAALARAIEEGQGTAPIGRDEVFNVLTGGE
jgi:hypothetical protein